MEHFYTIQGEGYHQGRAAYFLRLGGCDVGCVWCDVKDSWNADDHPSTSIEHMTNHVAKSNADIVVVTGGEPLMYNLDTLTSQLKLIGRNVHIETSGAYPLSGTWDWICVSPKKFKPCLPEALDQADELKIIVFNKSDFKFAEEYAGTVSAECKLYLQPEWSREKEMLPLIVDYIKDHPKWNISLQIHKYINVP